MKASKMYQMKIRKLVSIFLVLMMCVSAAGCADGAGSMTTDKKSIVCTIFPEYDWVKEIVGSNADRFELTMLLNNGVDMHSYQPTASDMAKIATCDLFIYVGGESDAWVEDALKEAVNKDIQVVNLLEILGDSVKEEEIVEGMEEEHHDEHHEEDSEVPSEKNEHHEEGPEYDEHVWLSLKNAGILVEAISKAVATIDAPNASVYTENAKTYKDKLEQLDSEYKKAVGSAKTKTLLFGDRFPFRYLTDDYGLDYYAAFAGCSAETEASFDTVTFLAGRVDELALDHVMVLESADQKIAQTIIDNTKSKNQTILVLNSMQAVSCDETAQGVESDSMENNEIAKRGEESDSVVGIENRVTYLGIMEDNLEVLKEALN